MPTICYWRGAIGEQALLELHKQAIQELVDGTYASTDLESLEGHRDIFSYRVSRSARLLFTTIERDGARYLLLLEYLPTHDYHKSRFLRSKVLSQYLINHEDELAQAAFQFKPVTAPPAVLENLTKTDEQDMPLECYDGQFIHLNTTQEEALKVAFPAVISGPAGSGKSCVAMSLLSACVNQSADADLEEGAITRILYVSKSNPLVRLMEESWHKLPISHELPAHIEVRFFTYEELLKEQGVLQDKIVVDRDDVDSWYKDYQKKQRTLKKAGQGGFFELDSDTVYQEFRICSVEGYAALGEKGSSLPKGEARKLLEEAYQAYMQTLRDRNAIHPEFQPLRDDSPCHMVLVDEAQAFSRLQLENLALFAKHHRAAFFMDSHQALSDVKSVRPFLLNMLRHQTKKEVSHIELTQGYRCPLNITRAANEIIRIKHQLTGGLADKAEVTATVPHITESADAGHVVILNKEQLLQWTWLREQAQGAHFAVIASPEHVAQAHELFPEHRVFTHEEIRGLEYETVVVFQPFVATPFKHAYQQLISQDATAAPQHRPKAGVGNDAFTIPFNEVFLAFTRAKKRLVILSEQRTPEEKCFLGPLLEIMGNTNLPEVEQEQSTSEQEWQNEIKRQVAQKQVERAFDIFCKIFNPAGDARQAFDEQYIKPTNPITDTIKTESTKAVAATLAVPVVAPISPKTQKRKPRPKKSEACQDTAPIPLTREAEHVLALLNDFSEKRFLTLANIYGLKNLCLDIPVTIDGETTALLAHIMNSKDKTQRFAGFIVNHLSLLVKMPIQTFADFIKQGPVKNYAQKEILNDLIEIVKKITRKYANDMALALARGDTPSAIAAAQPDVKLLVKLRQLGADFNKPVIHGLTPAHVAAQYGHGEVLKKLGEFKADLGQPDSMGVTPAHIVAANGQGEVLRMLGAFKADLNKAMNNGDTPAYIAANNGHVGALIALNELGVDLNQQKDDGSTPAHVATLNGHSGALRALKELGVNLDQQKDDGSTPTHIAAETGDIGALQVLYESGANFNQQKSDGATPAHFAAKNGDVGALKALYKSGANLNQPNKRGAAPAHFAAQHGHVGALIALKELGVDLEQPDKSGITAAHFAAIYGREEVLRKLGEFKVDLNKRTNNGATPAYAAAEVGHLGALKALKELGADLNQSDEDGITPAHFAAQNGHVGALKALYESGANLNQPSNDGATPAHAAAASGHTGALIALKELDADLNQQNSLGATPAYFAAQYGHGEVLRTLGEFKADLNKATNDGATPAHAAAASGHIGELIALKELGADLNQQNSLGATPAFIAAQDGHGEALRQLAELGADLDKPMHDGRTPAFIAAANGHIGALIALKELGADLNQQNSLGATPAFIAAQHGHLNIILFLLEIKADFSKHFISNIDSLTQFAENVTPSNPEIPARMSIKIAERIALGDPNDAIALLPVDIAEVMGHDNIVREIRLRVSQEHLPTLSFLSDSRASERHSSDEVVTDSPLNRNSTRG